MSDSAKLLMQFVISDGRVYPKRWNQFHQELLRHDALVPPPLILWGAIASDLAKRFRLLEQILAVKDDPEAFDSAERFLRGEPLSAWKCAPEPLSNTDSYGYQDMSRTHADAFIHVHTA